MTSRPDGGWGWVIAVSALTTNVIIDGVKYSFGIMFIELVDTFQRSKSETSWIISIQIGTLLLSGPIIAAFVNRFGCRAVGVTGSVLSCIGFIISAFAKSLYILYGTFGFLSGLGFGMMSMPVSVAIVRYFDKHLAFATGISAMGSGIGTLVFSALSKVLIDRYTWRGTLLIEAGFILNGVVCALTLIDPEKLSCNSRTDEMTNDTENNLNVKKPLIDRENDTRVQDTEQEKDIIEDGRYDKLQTTQLSNTNINDDYTGTHLQSSDCYSKDIEIDYDTELDNSGASRRWLSFQPLKRPGFCILLLANILIELALNTPFAFLPDMMYQRGFEKQQAVWIMFIIGVMSTVSRVVIGYIADLPAVNRVKLCCFLVTLNGVFVVLCPFCFNYASFVAFAVLFGISAGSSNSLRGVFIPDLFGVEMIADLYGIVMFFSAFTAFVGLPFGGLLFDITGKYILPFVVAGVELVAGGLLLALTPYVLKCWKTF